jgi:hypothetical protein
MNAQMEKAEATMAMTAMALPALRRIATQIWHQMDACSCDKWPFFVEGKPCEVGLEEIAIRKAENQFKEWDALGLGYIGPVLRQGAQS